MTQGRRVGRDDDVTASWPGADTGTTFFRTGSTPSPGAWVVTDLDATGQADPTYPDGCELGWSASGDGATYAYRGTFESAAGLSAALAAMERGPGAGDRHDAILAGGRFRATHPEGDDGRACPRGVRDLADGSAAYVTVGAETSLAVVAPGGLRRREVASLQSAGGGRAPWHAMSPGGRHDGAPRGPGYAPHRQWRVGGSAAFAPFLTGRHGRASGGREWRHGGC